MIEDAIVQAIPHDWQCVTRSTGGKCTCGAIGRRALLLVKVNDHVTKVRRYVYVDR
jgi:hypothetical protein